MNYVNSLLSLSKVIAKCKSKIDQNNQTIGNALFRESLKKPLILLIEENENLFIIVQVLDIAKDILHECSHLDTGIDQNYEFKQDRISFESATMILKGKRDRQ